MYRKTYVEVDLSILKNNIKSIIKKYKYKYNMVMVKSYAYGHGYGIVNTLVEAGATHLTCSSLDEAILIRKENKSVPILCVEVIDKEHLLEAYKHNISITITNINYLKEVIKLNKKFTVHIKVDSGMNRLGVKDKGELLEIYNLCKDNIYLEGIFTHFATPGINDKYYNEQLSNFKKITSLIDLKRVKIVHLPSSFPTINHKKIDIANGMRIGLISYGYDISLPNYSNSLKDHLRKIRDRFYQRKYKISDIIRGTKLDIKPCLKIKTHVMEIRKVKKGEFIGYGAEYIAKKDILAATLPIGYGDGIGFNNNRKVLINNKKYNAISRMSMCMMSVRVDENVKLGDEVTILGEDLTLGYLARLENKSIHYMLSNISLELERIYINKEK